MPRYDIKCMADGCDYEGVVHHGINDAHRCPECLSYDVIQNYHRNGVIHMWKNGDKPD